MVTTLFSDDGTASITAGGTTAPAQGTSEAWTATGSTLPSAATGTSQAYISDPAQPTEVMLVTNTSGGTLTVTRGADGTTPVAHAVPFTVFNVVPAGVLAPLGAAGGPNGVALLNSAGVLPLVVTFTYGSTGAVPASGTYTTGALAIDQNNIPRVCTAGGSPGTWARAYAQPSDYWVDDYGAKGDGKSVTDGAMSSSSNQTHLACATSTPFVAGDVGKTILVHGAGAAGADLITTIASFTDSGHVVLSASASTTVSGTGVIYGTDNTTAITSAISAAVTYAQAHSQYAEVVFRPAMYVVAGSFTTGATYEGNAIFPLPLINPSTSAKVTLVFKGLSETVDTLLHWLQPTVNAPGAYLAVLNNSGTNDATYGPATVVGGPWNGYGNETGSGLYTNLCPVVDGVGILAPFTGTVGGWNFYGCAEARIVNGAFMSMAVVPSGGAWPQLNQSTVSSGWSAGAIMPITGNNALADVLYWSAEGATWGIIASEHTTIESMRAEYCSVGIGLGAYPGETMTHAVTVLHADAEACGVVLGVPSLGSQMGGTGNVRVNIQRVSLENPSSTTNFLYDPSSHILGYVGFGGIGGGYLNPVSQNTTNLRAVNVDRASGPVSSPQAPPANNAAWANQYYGDAWITLLATTITAVKIDSTTQNGLAGSPASYSFLLPSGHSYTPTFTGTLSHTVSVL